MESKRQGLMAFPRVGRSGNQNANYLSKSAILQGIKRGVPGSNAMWFGPRLGRVQKRSSQVARDAMQGDHSV